MDVFLGIDTSCYTTSLCLVDAAYDVVADERIILSVAKGGRGLSISIRATCRSSLNGWLASWPVPISGPLP